MLTSNDAHKPKERGVLEAWITNICSGDLLEACSKAYLQEGRVCSNVDITGCSLWVSSRCALYICT